MLHRASAGTTDQMGRRSTGATQTRNLRYEPDELKEIRQRSCPPDGSTRRSSFIPFIKRELYDKVYAAAAPLVRMDTRIVDRLGMRERLRSATANVPARDFVSFSCRDPANVGYSLWSSCVKKKNAAPHSETALDNSN